ncbi:MAG: hypothetical protein OK474_04185 [Thaumarchaeota archaeon]|nr:hypothetical protein [Nitrososphaerota archaeon]
MTLGRRTPRRTAAIVLTVLLSASLLLVMPLLGSVRAVNPSPPAITIIKGDPFLDAANGSIVFTVTNPATNPYGITSLLVRAPSDWTMASCTRGSFLNAQCTVGQASAGAYVLYQASSGGTSLLPGASDTLVFTGSSAITSYPFEDSFTTQVTDTSSAVGTPSYPGPSFAVIVMAPSTAVTLIPGVNVNYRPGGPPINITVTVRPAQGGLPISFTAPGYGPGIVPAFSDPSVRTDSSGVAAISFAPSDVAGDSTDVVATIGTSGVFGVSGTISTLAAGSTSTPDFNLTVSPSAQGVGPGQDFSATVSVGRANSPSILVMLSVSGPAGTTLPAEVPMTGTTPFVAALTGVALLVPGSYVFVVTGRAGGVTHSANLTVAVLSPSIVLSSTSGVPGSSLTITGKDFPPVSSVSIAIGQTPLGTVMSTAQGTFVASFSIPQAFSAGNYMVTASSSRVGAARSFAVEPPPFPWIEVAEIAIASIAVAGGVGGFWAIRQSKPSLRPNDPKFTVTVTVTSSIKERRKKTQR